MEINGISSSMAASGTEKKAPTKEITREDFLKLLIAQLQNQDPLEPLNNQEFAVQLATFNSLEQLVGINTKLDSWQSKQSLSDRFNTASLIGKEVTTEGNQLGLSQGVETPIRYQLAGNAGRTVVNIKDARNDLVRQLELTNQKAGEQKILWDGKDKAGQLLPSGVYTFEVNAFDANGKKIAAQSRVEGTVTGVGFEGTEPMLELGQLRVPLSSITSVR